MAGLSPSARIDAAVEAHAMLRHPFHQAWAAGRLDAEALRTYAIQYYHHVDAFPRAISAIHANCPDRDGRFLLAENLAEEEGVGANKDDHASLWLGFVEALGGTEAETQKAALAPETAALIATLRDSARRSYAAGLGALYAYESQLPALAAMNIGALGRHHGVADPSAIRFFTVHETADVEHSAVCRALLDRLAGDEREEAAAAGAAMATALWTFLDGVVREAGPGR